MKIRMYAVAASTLLAFSSSAWAGGSLFGSDSESDLIAGSAEKGLRAGDQNDLPAPWSDAHRGIGGVSAAL